MTAPNESQSLTRKLLKAPAKLLGIVAIISALLFACLLGVRLVKSEDIGYHLAYGDQTLKTGKIVDHNLYIYTLIAHQGEKPGPGSSWASDGSYHFINANWLSQVIFSWVHTRWGMVGLSLLSALMCALIFLLIANILKRMKIPDWLNAAMVLLIAITCSERLYLRPELITYLLLVAQLALLVKAFTQERKLSLLEIAGLVALQVIVVNVHSYFLIGPVITGALFVDQLLRYAWYKHKKLPLQNAGRQGKLIMLTVALGLISLACLLNPYGAKLPMMAFKTLSYLRENNITNPTGADSDHPWATIAEFYPPFRGEIFCQVYALKAYLVSLILIGLGVIAGLIRKKWSAVFTLVAMGLISLSMRRNITIAGLVGVPIAIWCLVGALKPVCEALLRRCLPDMMTSEYRTHRAGKILLIITSGVLICIAGWLSLQVVTQEYYFSERVASRFGIGLNSALVPESAANWIDRYGPAGKLWCDYNSSSNIHYLTKPHQQVPIVTNTWAYPPGVMRENILQSKCAPGTNFNADIQQKYDIQMVVLTVDNTSSALIIKLALDKQNWAIVDVSTNHVLFLYKPGVNSRLARKQELTSENFDTENFVKLVKNSDPQHAHALMQGAVTLSKIFFDDQALELYREVLKIRPDYREASYELALLLSAKGANLYRQYKNIRQPALRAKLRRQAKRYYEEANEVLEKCLQIDPTFQKARSLRNEVHADRAIL